MGRVHAVFGPCCLESKGMETFTNKDTKRVNLIH